MKNVRFSSIFDDLAKRVHYLKSEKVERREEELDMKYNKLLGMFKTGFKPEKKKAEVEIY